jgi:hypothetical protein
VKGEAFAARMPLVHLSSVCPDFIVSHCDERPQGRIEALDLRKCGVHDLPHRKLTRVNGGKSTMGGKKSDVLHHSSFDGSSSLHSPVNTGSRLS